MTQPFILQWCGAPWPVLWGVYRQPGEGMQILPEQEVVPFAEGDAQSPQRALDPCPLGNAPAVSGEASQKVQECICGHGILPFVMLQPKSRSRARAPENNRCASNKSIWTENLVFGSGHKGKGHSREGLEQYHMLSPHKRATPTQRAAFPEPCSSTTRNTTCTRQHLAAPMTPETGNKIGGL